MHSAQILYLQKNLEYSLALPQSLDLKACGQAPRARTDGRTESRALSTSIFITYENIELCPFIYICEIVHIYINMYICICTPCIEGESILAPHVFCASVIFKIQAHKTVPKANSLTFFIKSLSKTNANISLELPGQCAYIFFLKLY